MQWNQWAILIVAGWILASPWVLGFAAVNLATWSNVVAGSFIVLLVLWNIQPPPNH
ncbi:SPW repeat protein [Candidatus Jorgensenbacteria bacterium]|nr:SPW repeat protein [Candidatus Jorgensenbacteria bacterium]